MVLKYCHDCFTTVEKCSVNMTFVIKVQDIHEHTSIVSISDVPYPMSL